MTEVWDEARVQQFVDDGTEESLNLDYKAAGALGRSDGKKKEITKDVSAMANSDGGKIIYGMTEDSNDKHLPGQIDPINRRDFSKEWLEQVIGNIRPKIDGLLLHPVPVGNSNSDVVYTVEIPKSHTAHQATDKRYYKRFNFESVPMDDYEIRDVMNRLQHPRIELEFSIRSNLKNESILESFGLKVTMSNTGYVYAQYVVAFIDVPHDIIYDHSFEHGRDLRRNDNAAEYKRCKHDNRNHTTLYDPVLPGLGLEVDAITLLSNTWRKLPEADYLIRWAVYADNAPPSTGEIAVADIEYTDARTESMTFGEFVSGIIVSD